MATYLVLYNQLADNGQGGKTTTALRESMKDDTLHFVSVTAVNDLKALLKEHAKDDGIILAGGDGTLNHFVNINDGLKIKLPILYYPCGSGNDFAKDIGKEKYCQPFEITEYLKDLPSVTIKGKTQKFINGIGYGIDGYCCEVGDKKRAVSDKPINYASIAIQGLLFHFKPINAVVTVDGERREYKKVWLAPTMNGRFYGGGMMPTPAQNRSDPARTVSVMIWHGSGKIRTLSVFPSLFKGEHIRHADICEVLSGHEITVAFDKPVAAQIDGETVLAVSEYTVTTAQPATKKSLAEKIFKK